MKKIAIQGERGSFHDIAAHQYFDGEPFELLCCKTFEQVFEHIQHDSSVIGLVAIENTIAGSLLHNYELLRSSGAVVIGEQKLHIKHAICCLASEDWSDIHEVHSHPVALAQCRNFLAMHSELKALQEDIHDNKHNFTRFLVLSNASQASLLRSEEKIDKASLVFSLPDEEGSLSKILTILSFYGINLTKIQSLPIIGREWEYMFYVDIVFSNPMRYRQSIDAITPLVKNIKILGEYESCK